MIKLLEKAPVVDGDYTYTLKLKTMLDNTTGIYSFEECEDKHTTSPGIRNIIDNIMIKDHDDYELIIRYPKKYFDILNMMYNHRVYCRIYIRFDDKEPNGLIFVINPINDLVEMSMKNEVIDVIHGRKTICIGRYEYDFKERGDIYVINHWLDENLDLYKETNEFYITNDMKRILKSMIEEYKKKNYDNDEEDK